MGNEKRVKYDHNNPRLPVFTERFRNLTEDCGGVTEMARVTGFSRPTVQFWFNGERTPDAENLITLSRTLGVSVDYLLGLSPAKTTDTDLQGVVKYTGLSVEAIEAIQRANNKAWWTYALIDEKDFYPASLPYGIGERLNEFLPLLVDKVLPILGKIEYLVHRASFFSKHNSIATGDRMLFQKEGYKTILDAPPAFLTGSELQRGNDVYQRLRYASLDLSEAAKDCADEIYHYRPALAELGTLLEETKRGMHIITLSLEDDEDENGEE